MTMWQERLQEALTARGKGWSDLVAATGKKRPSVYAWKPNATKPTKMMDGDNAAKVCAFLQINHDWLFHGILPSGLEQAPYSTAGQAREPSGLMDKARSMVRFERHPAPMSAGPGAFANHYDHNAIDFVEVSEWWARQFVGSCDPERIKVVPCRGSSMAPTIPDGSLLFVDVSVRHHIGDGIYCIDLDGRLLVKRIHIRAKDRQFSVISDNPNGPMAENYPLQEEDRLCICGRVVAWLATHRES